MRFSNKSILALLAQAIYVLAQSPNAFKVPQEGYNSVAGKTLTLNWTPTTSGTVSLILRSGASNALNAGTYIAQSIENTGTYTWDLPSDITRGSDYAVEIVSDSDDTAVNFTPYFVIDSTNTVASSTSQITRGATATATSSGVISGSQTGSSVSSAISSLNSAISSASVSGSSVASSLSSAVSASASSAASRSASGSSSAGSASSSLASRTSAAASSASSGASSAVSSATGGAAMATAVPGLMGALALAALVL